MYMRSIVMQGQNCRPWPAHPCSRRERRAGAIPLLPRPTQVAMSVAADADPEVAAVLENQQSAPRISLAEEARTLVAAGT